MTKSLEIIEEFIDEVIKDDDYELLDVLWSFALAYSLTKGYRYKNPTRKEIDKWVVIVTKRNLRKKYGLKAKTSKIEKVGSILSRVPNFLRPNSKEFDDDKKMLEQILMNKTSDLLIQNLKERLKDLSGLSLKVLSFLAYVMKQGNLTKSSDYDHYVLRRDKLEKMTYLFNQYFDEELRELRYRVKVENIGPFEQFRDYSFWQFGDELVKIGIAYWSFETLGQSPSISITPVLVIPNFIYNFIKNLDGKLLKIDESKVGEIKERYSSHWRKILENVENTVIYEEIPEHEIRDELLSNLNLLEDGLTLVDKEYMTPVGSIDILCRDRDGNYVVIELKKGMGSHEVVGQIQKYMAWISENLSKDGFVRGIIVVRDYDKHLEYALKGSKFPVEVKVFGYEPPTKENIKYCDNCGTPNRKTARYCRKCGQMFWM